MIRTWDKLSATTLVSDAASSNSVVSEIPLFTSHKGVTT